MNPKIDHETQEVLRQGRIAEDLVKGEGWGWAKQVLMERLFLLDSLDAMLSTKPSHSPDEFLVEAKARACAIALVRQWIADVEGAAAQHEFNRETLSQVRQNEVVRRMDT